MISLNKFKLALYTVTMYSENEYNGLKKKYGGCSSWAVWDKNNLNNASIIDTYIKDLNSTYVLIALNKSIDIDLFYWKNFHDYTHSRKLAYACNKTKLRGSYMTDLFKDLPEAVASNLDKNMTNQKVKESVEFFVNEMQDVNITPSSEFIIFGQVARKYYEKYFAQHFTNPYKIVRHYSDFRMSDEAWIAEFWETIRVTGNAENTVSEYRKLSK
jgi:hypothetical protein